jgi:hypothetical protein
LSERDEVATNRDSAAGQDPQLITAVGVNEVVAITLDTVVVLGTSSVNNHLSVIKEERTPKSSRWQASEQRFLHPLCENRWGYDQINIYNH